MSTPPVTVVIVYRARPGNAEVARAELAALISTVVATEPACLGIVLHQDVDDPTRFLLYERWVDKESYVGDHMQTPHIRAFIGRAGAFLAGPPEIAFWRSVGESA